MAKKLDVAFLQKELDRVTELIRTADRKAAFLTAYYSTILGIILANREHIFDTLVSYHTGLQYVIYVVAILAGISFLKGVFFLLSSMFPRLVKPEISDSILYFDAVAGMPLQEYLKKVEKLSEAGYRKQISEQIHIHAIIASKKLSAVQNSMRNLAFLILFALIFIVL